MDDTLSRLDEMLLAKINELAGGDTAYSVSGPVSVVQSFKTMAGEAFKRKPLKGDEEFFFMSAKQGKREEFIFVFTAVDSQEYTHIEIPLRELQGSMPKFYEAFLTHMKIEGTNTTQLGRIFTAWRKKFSADLGVERQKEAEKRAQVNPLWGTW